MTDRIAPAEQPPLDVRCDRTDLLVRECAHCRGHDDPVPAVADEDVWATFVARYDGKCANCAKRYRAGQLIGRLVDGGGYVGPECLP